MLFAGFNVFQGHLSLFGIIVFGVLGRHDRRLDRVRDRLLRAARAGRAPRQQAAHLDAEASTARDAWFERYGAPMIVVSRWIPFARAAFPYAAGVARMPFWRFLTFATIGSIVWITALGVLGNAVGQPVAELAPQPRVRRLRMSPRLLLAAIVYLIVRVARDARGSDPAAVA